MKNIIHAVLLGSSLLLGNAIAAPIYIQADNVEGLAAINYDISYPMNEAPEFSFVATSGSLSHNLADYVPGDYTVDFLLEGFWIDYNNDSVADYSLPDLSFSDAGPLSLGPLPPLSGSDGAFSWEVNPTGGNIWFSYDFDSVFDASSWSNSDVNGALAMLDLYVSGSANGVMDAIIGWDKLRVQLNPVGVPEPSVWLLAGIGLLGFGWARRQRRVVGR